MCYFECREAVVEGAFRYSFLLGVTSFRIGLQKNGTAIYGVAYVTGQECQYVRGEKRSVSICGRPKNG